MAVKYQGGKAVPARNSQNDVEEYEQFAQAYRDAKRAMVMLYDAKRKAGGNFSPAVTRAMNDLTMALDQDMKTKRINP
jgi:hypothetical protein